MARFFLSFHFFCCWCCLTLAAFFAIIFIHNFLLHSGDALKATDVFSCVFGCVLCHLAFFLLVCICLFKHRICDHISQMTLKAAVSLISNIFITLFALSMYVWLVLHSRFLSQRFSTQGVNYLLNDSNGLINLILCTSLETIFQFGDLFFLWSAWILSNDLPLAVPSYIFPSFFRFYWIWCRFFFLAFSLLMWIILENRHSIKFNTQKFIWYDKEKLKKIENTKIT